VILETLRKIKYQGKCVIELTKEECNADNFEKGISYLSKIHNLELEFTN
jgi:hypothetical protein